MSAAADPFTFFRESPQRFAGDLPPDDLFEKAPSVWCCANLHLESFRQSEDVGRRASIRIDNGGATVLAPCSHGLARLLISVLIWCYVAGFEHRPAMDAVDATLSAYARTASDPCYDAGSAAVPAPLRNVFHPHLSLPPGALRATELELLTGQLGIVVGAAHAGGAGRDDAASATELRAFLGGNLWRSEIRDFAMEYAPKVIRIWRRAGGAAPRA